MNALTQEQVLQRFAEAFMNRARVVRKIAPVLAKVATGYEVVTSEVGGRTETHNMCRPGDYLVMSGPSGPTYVIDQDIVATKLHLDSASPVPGEIANSAELTSAGFQQFVPIGQARLAVEVVDGDLPEGCFMARWGSIMVCEVGDFVVGLGARTEGIQEIYRVQRDEFFRTYEFAPEGPVEDDDPVDVGADATEAEADDTIASDE